MSSFDLGKIVIPSAWIEKHQTGYKYVLRKPVWITEDYLEITIVSI